MKSLMGLMRLGIVFPLTLLMLAFAPKNAQCVGPYQIYDIGPTNTDTPEIHIASETDEVFGSYWVTGKGQRAFRWTMASGRVILSSTPDDYTSVQNVNAHGNITGYYSNTNFTYRPSTYTAYYLVGSTRTDISPCAGYETSYGRDINESSQITGTCNNWRWPNPDENQAFVYSATEGVTPLFDFFLNSEAWAINASGQVAATVRKTGQSEYQRTVVRSSPPYSSSSYAEASLPGDWAIIYDMNDSGAMVGNYSTIGGGLEGYFLFDSSVTVLHNGGWDTVMPSSINNNGEIVGGYNNINAGIIDNAFIRSRSGQYSDLNDAALIGGSGWHLWRALDIDDRGWIVGVGSLNGSSPRYYLLVPAGAPGLSTGELAACAGLLVILAVYAIQRRQDA